MLFQIGIVFFFSTTFVYGEQPANRTLDVHGQMVDILGRSGKVMIGNRTNRLMNIRFHRLVEMTANGDPVIVDKFETI